MEAYQHFESKLVGRKSRPGATIPPLSTATRTNELILLNKRPEIDDSEMSDDPDGTSSDEISGKDETEQKLETLVFGDQAGFHDALKSYDQKLGSYSATSNAVDFDDEGSDSTQLTNTFADVDDADVSSLENFFYPITLLISTPVAKIISTFYFLYSSIPSIAAIFPGFRNKYNIE